MKKSSLLLVLFSFTSMDVYGMEESEKKGNCLTSKPQQDSDTKPNLEDSRGQARDQEPQDQLALQRMITQFNIMSSTLNGLMQTISSLETQNRTLSSEVRDLQIRLNASAPHFSARLYNDVPIVWSDAPQHQGWHAMVFTHFEGDIRLRNENSLSHMQIPGDGFYRISASFDWLSTDHPSTPYSAISVDDPSNHVDYKLMTLMQGQQAGGSLQVQIPLRTGQKVMMGIQTSQGKSQYCLRAFKLDIQKLL